MGRYIRNIAGSLGTVWHHVSKRYFIMMVYELLADNARQLLGIIVPALIVDCLSSGGSAGRVLALAGAYAGIVVLTDMSRKALSLFSTAYWYRAANLSTFDICEKGMRLECADLDSASTIDEYKRAVQSPWEFLCVDELVVKRMAGAVLTLAEMLWILSRVHVAVMLAVLALSIPSAAIRWKKAGVLHDREAKVKNLERRADYPLQLLQGYQAGKEIRIYHMLPFITDVFRRRNRRKRDASLETERHGAAMESLADLIDFVKFVLVYGVAIARYAAGAHSLGAFTMYYGALQAVSEAMGALFQNVADIRNCCLYYEDYRAFLQRDGEASEGTEEAQMGEIRFDHVGFSYPGGVEVLRDLDFSIREGERIALVGENGAGKSTLVKLVTGLYRPTSGQITLGGKDVGKMSRESYYALFAPVFQDFELYSIPVRDNVAFQHAAEGDGSIWEALGHSGAEAVVRCLPGGLQTMVTKLLDDQGVEFSGGEAQRLVIARAYYKNAPVLILDEPTASLDPMAEEEIYRHVHGMSGGKTVIYISHRISTTRYADRIIVIGEGGILEEGSFAQLMEKKGVYYGMFEQQATPYRD